MARPIKRTVNYFPHDSDASGKKTLSILFNNFGHEGISAWWMLLECLASTENHVIDTRNPDELEFLAAKMHFTPGRLLQIVDKLAEIGTIDTELWFNNRMIWSQNFINRISDVYNKRNQELPGKPEFIVSDTDNITSPVVSGNDNHSSPVVSATKPPQDATEMQQIKLNKIKLNKTKREEEDEKSSENTDAPLFDSKRELLEEAKRFAAWFKKLIPEEQKTTPVGIASWEKCYVQLREIDKRSKAEIAKICEYGRNDDFWCKNFLSPLKLRRKDKSGVQYYDVLKSSMDTTKPKGKAPEPACNDSITDWSGPEYDEKRRLYREHQAQIAQKVKERLEKEAELEVKNG